MAEKGVHTARFRVLVQPATRWKKEEAVLFVAERLAARRTPRLPTAWSSAPGWAHSTFGRARAT
jgi:hypothetical protein